MHFRQVLVLSHEMAPVGSRLPYEAIVFQPMVPFVLYGRSARMEPQCPGEDAVSWAWRDTGVPIITDPVFPSEARTLIFQVYFRFSKSDANAAHNWLQRKQEELRQKRKAQLSKMVEPSSESVTAEDSNEEEEGETDNRDDPNESAEKTRAKIQKVNQDLDQDVSEMSHKRLAEILVDEYHSPYTPDSLRKRLPDIR